MGYAPPAPAASSSRTLRGPAAPPPSCACYPRGPWVEHFDWLDPLFNERLETKNGRMIVPDRPGLGVTLSDQARAWTTESVEFGA